MRFRFIHAADLHLDSPLIGLSQKSPEFAARVNDASRAALDNLVNLAIEEECRLLVIAGDVFDREWKDYRTGQFFTSRMRRLGEHGVTVVMIFGNHDAENQFAARLEFSGNVKLLSAKRPETALIDDIAAVHGQSFAERAARENIALAYPAAVAGRFNIGLLHTSATGGRGGHVNYAPCSVEQLANHGYQYWALGHIHAREELCAAPPIVFAGNLQGRSVRETGPKGASLVTVEDGAVVAIEHRALDAVRFCVETIDAANIEDRTALHAAIREAAGAALAAADGRALALRLILSGSSPLHADLAANAREWREEIETLLSSAADDVWLEKLELKTSPPPAPLAVDPTVSGALARTIEELAGSGFAEARLAALLDQIRTRLPAGAHAQELFARLEAEGPARARALAQALIEKGRA